MRIVGMLHAYISSAVFCYDGCKSVEFLLPLFIQWHDSKLRSLLNFTCEHIIIFFSFVCANAHFFSVAFYWKMLLNMNFWTLFVLCSLFFASSLSFSRWFSSFVSRSSFFCVVRHHQFRNWCLLLFMSARVKQIRKCTVVS